MPAVFFEGRWTRLNEDCLGHQCTRWPGCAPVSGERTKISLGGPLWGLAAQIMPSDGAQGAALAHGARGEVGAEDDEAADERLRGCRLF